MQKQKNIATPIIVLVLAIALIGFTRYIQTSSAFAPLPKGIEKSKVTVDITQADHIRGDINAPITIVEYSDLECPYCKLFHPIMLEIEDKYVKTGKASWVYRHFPLTQIHPDAQNLAIATECVAKIGGNDAFWKMIDGIFADSGKAIDMTKLPTLAKNSGANVTAYANCFASKETESIVNAQAAVGRTLGISGTPYAIIVAPNGDTFTASGYLTTEQLSVLLDRILDEKK